MDPTMKKPALISGVILGLLAGIGSAGGGIGCCCCGLLAIGAGVLAVKLYQDQIGGRAVPPADGAKVGVFAGGIAAAIHIIIGLAVYAVLGALGIALQNNEYQSSMPAIAQMVGGIMAVILGALINVGLATAGGAIGSAIFKGTSGPPSYPSTPGVGGPYGGGTPFDQGGAGSPYGQQGGGNPYGGSGY